MTKEDAARLLNYVTDQYGDKAGRLVPLSDGREWAVRIASTRGCWFCFTFVDWTAYRHEAKRQAMKARKREDVYQRSIDFSQQHSVLLQPV